VWCGVVWCSVVWVNEASGSLKEQGQGLEKVEEFWQQAGKHEARRVGDDESTRWRKRGAQNQKLLEGQDQGKNGLLGAAGVTLFKHWDLRPKT
jgi:hypothetical protein